MEGVIDSLERVIEDLELLKMNLEENIYKDDFENEEKINLVKKLRNQNVSIDDISILSDLSIREVINILEI